MFHLAGPSSCLSSPWGGLVLHGIGGLREEGGRGREGEGGGGRGREGEGGGGRGG